MNKLQIIWTLCITIIGIVFYFAIWINSDITLSGKLMLSGAVLFIQSTVGIMFYETLN